MTSMSEMQDACKTAPRHFWHRGPSSSTHSYMHIPDDVRVHDCNDSKSKATSSSTSASTSLPPSSTPPTMDSTPASSAPMAGSVPEYSYATPNRKNLSTGGLAFQMKSSNPTATAHAISPKDGKTVHCNRRLTFDTFIPGSQLCDGMDEQEAKNREKTGHGKRGVARAKWRKVKAVLLVGLQRAGKSRQEEK